MSLPLPNRNNGAGFSLVEVMIALTIFGFISIGIAKGVIQLKTNSRALTIEQAVDETIQGYISQLKAGDYNTLASNIESGTGTMIQVENNFTLLSLADPEKTRVENHLELNDWETHTLYGHDFETTGVLENIAFNMDVKLEMTNQNTVSEEANQRRYITARIDYQWKSPLRPQRTGYREFIIGDDSNSLSDD
ncbi:MAG: PulJ/GspJ family protein [Opitutales bacterium]